MIKVGIIGFDTSHAVEFTKRMNHVDISEEHWVYGAKVIMGYPGRPSSFAGNNVITQRIQLLKEFGVEIVDSAEEMIGKVNAVMLEQQEGGLHLEIAKPFIEKGIHPEETIEIIAFLEASLKSAIESSKEIYLSELIDSV
ncbi:hypothetical protein KEJ27_09630 [Candidatus Bathyarchaeota archaeon]|nr:hypothetical protein [Candidatus Bathyarchaeota archaeon]MBS7617631.1 hypothetical protein [Candidatus Bathyarchaeota archaeon]